MKKKIYYVVEKELQNVGEVEATTGHKDVTVYEIVNNEPVKLTTLSALNEERSEELILDFLVENDYDEDEVELIIL